MSADRNPGVGRSWLGNGLEIRGPLPSRGTDGAKSPDVPSVEAGANNGLNTTVTGGVEPVVPSHVSEQVSREIREEMKVARYSRRRMGRVTGRWGN